ncbi:MAG: glycosyltransferase [Chloroflexota bacterium]|nr:glycosyltransferase [Chloroflexota bacterium]
MTTSVTFVIPSYNYGRYVRQAVDSLLGQTFRALDIIVVDDASTDNTAEVLARYREEPRVRVVRHATNQGHIASYNDGLSMASGEFVGLLSADDFAVAPDGVERQVAMFEANTGVGLVYSAYQLVRADGTPFHVTTPRPADTVVDGLDAFRELLFENTVPASGTLVRRACHEALGWYDASFPHANDWDLWLRLSSRYDVGYVAAPLYAYRIHAANMSIQAVRPRQAVDELRRVIDKNVALLDERQRAELLPLLAPARRHALFYTLWGDLGYGRPWRAWRGLASLPGRSPSVLADRVFYTTCARALYLTLVGRQRYRRRFGGFDV